MASIRLGAGITGISGSIGGTTFGHNRFGAYMRARTTPVNPNTFRQSRMRSFVADVSAAWGGALTVFQRAAWEVYAASLVSTNRLGEQIKLTGFNHYIRSNTFRLQNVLTRIDDAPTILTLPGEDTVFLAVVDEANQEISVTFDETRTWVDQDNGGMGIYMSKPQGVGTTFITGPWKKAGTIVGDSTTPPTGPQTFTAPFPVAVGQVIAVRARITEEDGRLSDLFRDTNTVTA